MIKRIKQSLQRRIIYYYVSILRTLSCTCIVDVLSIINFYIIVSDVL